LYVFFNTILHNKYLNNPKINIFMQAQSTNFSQKLTKYNQIISVLAFCTVATSLFTTISISAQVSEISSSSLLATSSISRISSSSTTSSAASSSPTQTQSPVSQPVSRINNQVIPIVTTTFVGELDRKENNTIYVSKDNQVKQYVVTNDIKVRRDSMESNINMLRVGDKLTINQSQDGQKVFSIDAISKQSDDLIKYAIAAAVLALILIPLIIYLLTRSKRGHIKTNTSTRS
jgi:hypothetical protein